MPPKTYTAMPKTALLFKTPSKHPELLSVLSSDPKPPLIILKIDLEDGRMGDLIIYSQCEIPAACQKFCETYNLAIEDFHKTLTTFVREQLHDAIKPRLSFGQKDQNFECGQKLVPSNRNSSKKIPKEKIQQVNQTFDRLWLNATEGAAYREFMNDRKFESMHPFKPDLTKLNPRRSVSKSGSKSCINSSVVRPRSAVGRHSYAHTKSNMTLAVGPHLTKSCYNPLLDDAKLNKLAYPYYGKVQKYANRFGHNVLHQNLSGTNRHSRVESRVLTESKTPNPNTRLNSCTKNQQI